MSIPLRGAYAVADEYVKAYTALTERVQNGELSEEEASQQLDYLSKFLKEVVDEQVDLHFTTIHRIHMLPAPLRSISGVPIHVHNSPAPLAYYSAKVNNLQQLEDKDFTDEAIILENQHISLAAPVALALLSSIYPNVAAGREEFVGFRSSYHVENIPQEFRDLLQKIPSLTSYDTTLQEFNFLLIHEFLHMRLGHLILRLRMKEDYPLPATVYNIGEDLFIHLLMLSFPEFIRQVQQSSSLKAKNFDSSNYKNYEDYLNSVIPAVAEVIPIFKNSVRPLVEDDGEDEELLAYITERLNEYGIKVSASELKSLFSAKTLIDEGVHELDDEGVIIWLYEKFKEFFETFEELSDEIFEQVLDELSNESQDQSQVDSQNNTGQNSCNSDGNQTEGATSDEEENSGDGSSKNSAPSTGSGKSTQNTTNSSLGKSVLEKAMERFEEKMKDALQNEAKDNKGFRESTKRLATTAGLPDLKETFLNKLKERIAANASKVNSDVEASRGEQFLQQLIQEIEESQKSQGFIPGFGRKLRILKAPRPKFIEILRKFGRAHHVGGLWPSYSVPNKKLQSKRILFPSQLENQPKIAVVIDTSGSMSDTEIGLFLGMMKHTMRVFRGAEFHFLWNDADYSVTKYTGKQYKKLEKDVREKGVAGGGGSVFVEVFDDKAIKNADMVLFISDFMISLPKKKFHKPFVLIPTPHYDPGVLDYAKQIFPKSLVYPLKSKEFEPRR